MKRSPFSKVAGRGESQFAPLGIHSYLPEYTVSKPSQCFLDQLHCNISTSILSQRTNVGKEQSSATGHISNDQPIKGLKNGHYPKDIDVVQTHTNPGSVPNREQLCSKHAWRHYWAKLVFTRGYHSRRFPLRSSHVVLIRYAMN